MKFFLLGIGFVMLGLVTYLIYDEYTYSPLKNSDFNLLFRKDDNIAKKSCSVDFLGISTKGEFFEAYLYKMNNALVNTSATEIKRWENNDIISEENIVTNWKQCPIDSQALNLYKFTLTLNDFNKVECFSLFNNVLKNPNNYYRYIHFNELEQYFLLYDVDREELYYLRKNGF